MNDRPGFGILFEENVAMPMRDGVVLRANIFRPDAPGRFPGLLMRTPYGKPSAGYERYVRAGYVVVAQDMRGRYASDGDYVPFTVENTGDAEDGYDSVEWLAHQPYCNGNVGTIGVSYCAWVQWKLAKLRPPHLKAMCAYSIPQELADLDWPGTFRPGRRVHWWINTIAPDIRRRRGLPGPHTPQEALHIWNDLEHARWLDFKPWIDLPKYLPPPLSKYVAEWLRNPSRPCWKFREAYREIEVPNLDFTGWFDHCNGTMGHLAGMQREARTEVARTQTKLIIGPWNHVSIGSRELGGVDFGPQAGIDIHDVILRWFDRWLKGIPNGIDREPPVRYFVMGTAAWKSADTWPPNPKNLSTLYLNSSGQAHNPKQFGQLLDTAPDEAPTDRYVYDPRNPVPTLWSPMMFTTVSDRRELEYREDILRYRTAPLRKDVEIVGYPEVVLYITTSAPDTDFFARLVDEHPDGRALDVSYGMTRVKYRNGTDREDLVASGQVVELKIKLGATACRFLKGHCIRLEITSSDFPNYDRNHNTGKNEIFDAEMVTAEQHIFHDKKHPSRLILPVCA